MVAGVLMISCCQEENILSTSLLAAEDPSRRFPIVPEETEWRTFRDIDTTSFSSLYTGAKFAPLPGHWMDLGDDGKPLATSLEGIETEE